MIALVYLKSSKEIIMIVSEVQSYTDTDIDSSEANVKGIDLTQADFCIVESTDLQLGDTLGAFTDVRSQLPPTKEQQMQQQIEDLNLAIADILTGR